MSAMPWNGSNLIRQGYEDRALDLAAPAACT
jgi:hypothetical protein